MKKYQVTANDAILGEYVAENEKEARDLAAEDAGYDSEEDMEYRLGQESQMAATLIL